MPRSFIQDRSIAAAPRESIWSPSFLPIVSAEVGDHAERERTVIFSVNLDMALEIPAQKVELTTAELERMEAWLVANIEIEPPDFEDNVI